MKTIRVDASLYRYMLEHSTAEAPTLAALREETARHAQARMQIPTEQGSLMALLCRIGNVRRYLEVGTFTGYSALAVALALPPDGEVVACDISEDFTAVARRYWQRAGVADKIDLRLAPAIDSLQELLAAGRGGSFDLAFIDADKQGYPDYYRKVVDLVRPGGMIMLDNVLWAGEIADPQHPSPDAQAIRRVNQLVANDTRVQATILPVGDGITLAVKNAA